MKSMVCLLCLLALINPLSFAGKKPTEPKVFPEARPDKALVYVCRGSGGVGVLLDDGALGGLAWERECSFDHVEPGTHYLWSAESRFVEPLAISVFEWDFEPGETYYFRVSLVATITWGNKGIATYQLLDEQAGKQAIAVAKRFNREVTPKAEKFFRKLAAEQDPSTANNPMIASRRLEQGLVRGKSAEAKDGAVVVQGYEAAVNLLEEAADKFDELARVTRKRKLNATFGNILGPKLPTVSAQMQAEMHQVGVGTAYYSIMEIRSFKELIAKYESLAIQARIAETEYRRRLACHVNSADEAEIIRCISEVGDEQ